MDIHNGIRLLGYSIEMLLLTPLTPYFWGSLAPVVVCGVFAARRRDLEEEQSAAVLPRRRVEYLLLAIVPVVLLGIGVGFAADGGAVVFSGTIHIEHALPALLAMQAILAAWLTWRHRHDGLLSVLLPMLAVAWCASSMIVSHMSVTDDWL